MKTKEQELKEELNRIKGLVKNIEGKIEELKLEKEDKFAELKEAYKNGAVIQYKSWVDGEWYDVKSDFDFDFDLWHEEYRIKPEEKPKVGDVCKFWDNEDNVFVISKLTRVYADGFYTLGNIYYPNAKHLTKQEAIELLFGSED